ncbi:MAG: nucleoside-diphosphate kinase [Spirochaetia bacterium]
MERSYVMLKPGVLQRRLVGEIIGRFERKGLIIQGLKMMQIPKETAEHHYGEHKGKPFFPDLIGYITSAPVVAMVVAGEDAIKHIRTLCGATKIEEALPGTIRGDLAGATTKNVIHASDGPETAEREIDIFFTPEEVFDYDVGNGEWVS